MEWWGAAARHGCSSYGERGVGPLLAAAVPGWPNTADEALAALDLVRDWLIRCGDPRAAFPDVYAVITREVASQIKDNSGLFLEPAWISRLAGRFCERYLQTLAAALGGREQDCDAWKISYRAGELRSISPLHRATLGLNAHITYDLALGIFQNIVESGCAHDARMLRRYKHDHDAVNMLLQASIPESFERMIHEHGCAVSAFLYRRAPGSSTWLIMEVLRRWRSRVWIDVEALLDARGDDERRAVVQRMNSRSRCIGYALAAPAVIAGALS